MSRRRTTFRVVFASVFLFACSDHRSPTDVQLQTANLQAAVSPSGGGLVRTLQVLPPLRKPAASEGRFDGTLLEQLTVEICESSGGACRNVVERFTREGKGSEALRLAADEGGHYHVNWHTGKSRLDARKTYLMRVLVAGNEVGREPVRVIENGDDEPGTEIVVKNGRTVPIKLWISRERLGGNPGDPANAALPWRDFVARAADYSDDHPRLRGLYVSHNTFMLAFRPETTVGQANAVLDNLDATIVGSMPGDSDVSGILFFRLAGGTHAEMENVLSALRQSPVVEDAVQDALLGMDVIARSNGNRPASWLWELEPSDGNWGLEISRVPQMWNLNAYIRKRAEPRQFTGILDAGFASFHDDLAYADNLTPGVEHNHGTHVAGIIRATFDNGIGVDGINPFTGLVVKAGTFFSTRGGPQASIGQNIISELNKLLTSRPNIRVVNLSFGLNWGSALIDPDVTPHAQEFIRAHGLMFKIAQAVLQLDRPLPVIAVSAGNSGDKQSRYSSPMTNAALVHGAANIIVVEAVENTGTIGTGTRRARFSHIGGHISAPGVDILSTWGGAAPDDYAFSDGTSMAAPHVAGLVGYLYALDPTLPAPTLRVNGMRDLLVNNAVPTDGRSQPRIDAFATALDIDRVQGGTRVLRGLLDVDDGTRDGNQRTASTGGDYTAEDADGDNGPGDGVVDMSDFRRFRDWLLQAEGAAGLSLDGSANHPKKDLNGDGPVQSRALENVYPRGDFNGDGVLSRTATRRVRGALAGNEVTDLQVLQHLFSDPNYQAAQLPGLLASADLEIRAETCLALEPVVRVVSSIRIKGTAAPVQSRTHVLTGATHLYTAPVHPAGYTARAEAFGADGAVIASAERDFPLSLGSDARWDPECAPSNLIVNGGFELPVAPALNYLAGMRGTSVPGWVITRGDIEVTNQFWQPAEGNQSIDLNGVSPATIHQDVTTTTGATYDLSFALAGNPFNNNRRNKVVDVFWGPATGTLTRVGRFTFVQTLAVAGVHAIPNLSMGWQTITVPGLTATTTRMRLQFVDVTTGCAACGPALDQIVLTQR